MKSSKNRCVTQPCPPEPGHILHKDKLIALKGAYKTTNNTFNQARALKWLQYYINQLTSSLCSILSILKTMVTIALVMFSDDIYI